MRQAVRLDVGEGVSAVVEGINDVFVSVESPALIALGDHIFDQLGDTRIILQQKEAVGGIAWASSHILRFEQSVRGMRLISLSQNLRSKSIKIA